MSKNFKTVDEAIGYVTAENPTNTDKRYVVGGSKNVLIDQQRKVRSRNGNSRFGAADAALTPVTGGATWNSSTGVEFELRVKNGVLQVYLDTVDTQAIAAYTDILSGLSTSIKPRFTTWYNDTEVLDTLVFVIGSDIVYQWSGGVAVVDSVTATTITKKGTDTFAKARFYTSANKTLVNVRTGTEYTYTGGEDTLTLTGIADTTGIIAGDILVQKVQVNTSEPQAGRNNHTPFLFENQLCLASDDDEEVYLSKNTNLLDFSFSSPRVAGEGAILTLDDPGRGFAEVENSLVVFAGRSSIYQVSPEEITVGTTLTEALKVKKYQGGLNQSAQNQEVIQVVGSTIYYLSFEPALRELPSPSLIQGGQDPRTLSNPIKPDFDAETWTGAVSVWYDNAYHLAAPSTGRVYILQFREDADGKLRRFWQPPQTMFINAWTTYGDDLHGHSSVVGETYRVFDPEVFSDINSNDEKIPIHCIAQFAYQNYGDRVLLKNFDEYFVEGEISPSTVVDLTLRYDFGGKTQTISKQIDGSDEEILLETLANLSLGQQPLAQQSLGGSIDFPSESAKFRVTFENAKEDFTEIQDRYETNDVDKYWAILSRGCNAQLSKRQNTIIKK